MVSFYFHFIILDLPNAISFVVDGINNIYIWYNIYCIQRFCRHVLPSLRHFHSICNKRKLKASRNTLMPPAFMVICISYIPKCWCGNCFTIWLVYHMTILFQISCFVSAMKQNIFLFMVSIHVRYDNDNNNDNNNDNSLYCKLPCVIHNKWIPYKNE